jgi:hypothetical protein
MSTLMQANAQWSSRPDEERFTSLPAMHDLMTRIRQSSKAAVVPSRKLHALPTDDARGLVIEGPSGNQVAPTHYAFGQLATLAGAPAGYLRDLPSPIAADCINYGLQFNRDVEDVGVLLTRQGDTVDLRAATGPNYGRIWNSDIVGGLMRAFGDGVTGRFRVPVEFGSQGGAHPGVTNENTTLYASDRDMFVFLADEANRIEMPNRRGGRTGSLARGFFVWNSEVGAATFGITSFLFDFMCGNHIVWGAENVEEIRIRHTSKAPVRWIEEMAPALERMADTSTVGVTRALEDARAHRLGDSGDVAKFLANRFGAKLGQRIAAAHVADEARPIETRWDVVTGATALARALPYAADRVALETEAGKLLVQV